MESRPSGPGKSPAASRKEKYRHVTDVSPLTAEERRFLAEAAQYLEHPGFLMKAANLVGKPAEGLMRVLPARVQTLAADATRSALDRALHWAVSSLDSDAAPIAGLANGPRFHMALSATTGALGGLFGLAGAALELPATTMIMLRSIAQIAARSGADLRDPETRLQCLAVFSYGSPELNAMESAYFSSRLGTTLAMRDAARYLAEHSMRELGENMSRRMAPALVRLVQQIASRFQIVVTEKMAAQAVPIAGAALGSLVNAAFTDHFNRVAEFHFGIVKLERRYGAAPVQAAYQQAIVSAQRAAS